YLSHGTGDESDHRTRVTTRPQDRNARPSISVRLPHGGGAVAATVQASRNTPKTPSTAPNQEGTLAARSNRNEAAAIKVSTTAVQPSIDPASVSIELRIPVPAPTVGPNATRTAVAGNNHTSKVAHVSPSCSASIVPHFSGW